MQLFIAGEKMVRLAGTFSRLRPKKILLAGDLLVDTYTFGKAKRISPEAPVAIVNIQKEEHRPGGAGNVILNILSMGSSVVSLGRIGDDAMGQMLCDTLQKEGAEIEGIFI